MTSGHVMGTLVPRRTSTSWCMEYSKLRVLTNVCVYTLIQNIMVQLKYRSTILNVDGKALLRIPNISDWPIIILLFTLTKILNSITIIDVDLIWNSNTWRVRRYRSVSSVTMHGTVGLAFYGRDVIEIDLSTKVHDWLKMHVKCKSKNFSFFN